jgi:hypothetical protein
VLFVAWFRRVPILVMFTSVTRAETPRALACGLVAVAILAACGDADGTGDDPILADLTVTVAHPDHPTIEYRLVCREGNASTVEGTLVAVDPDRACEAVQGAETQTLLIEGPRPDQVCPQVYGGPDVATVTGNIGEQPVSTTVDRADGCGINEWDQILGDVLPPPRDVNGAE